MRRDYGTALGFTVGAGLLSGVAVVLMVAHAPTFFDSLTSMVAVVAGAALLILASGCGLLAVRETIRAYGNATNRQVKRSHAEIAQSVSQIRAPIASIVSELKHVHNQISALQTRLTAAERRMLASSESHGLGIGNAVVEFQRQIRSDLGNLDQKMRDLGVAEGVAKQDVDLRLREVVDELRMTQTDQLVLFRQLETRLAAMEANQRTLPDRLDKSTKRLHSSIVERTVPVTKALVDQSAKLAELRTITESLTAIKQVVANASETIPATERLVRGMLSSAEEEAKSRAEASAQLQRQLAALLRAVQDGLHVTQQELASAESRLDAKIESRASSETVNGLMSDVGHTLRQSVDDFRRDLGTLRGQVESIGDGVQQAANGADSYQSVISTISEIEALLARLAPSIEEQSQGILQSVEKLRAETVDSSAAALEAMHATDSAIQAHVSTTSIDGVRQVEALLQLIPRVRDGGRSMPGLGSWSMTPEGMLVIADLIQERTPKTIVELGSGASTAWLARLSEHVGSRVISVEHSRKYFDKTTELLKRLQLNRPPELLLAELSPVEVLGHEYSWYDLDAISGVSDIDLLLVDGPPKAMGKMSRLPAAPLLIDRLSDTGCIVLDDAHRRDEKAALEIWLAEFPQLELRDSGSERVALLVKRG